MKKNSLSTKGLSLSQAQSISNLCNQRAIEIQAKLGAVNNFSKSIKIGAETNERYLVKPSPLPTNVVELLEEKSRLHACQSFLVENIKAKDALIKEAKAEAADVSSVVYPEQPKKIVPKLIPQVADNEENSWGWEQLSAAEYNEYLESNSFASHIGKFIHKDGQLTVLREELPNTPAIEWFEIEQGKKSPVTITIHESHTPEKLLELHEKLAKLHRDHEQKVNSFKARVKNLTTARNAEIANLNADAINKAAKENNDAQTEFETLQKKANEQVNIIRAEFEKTRQAKIKEYAAMRIEVDPRFQPVIDLFKSQLPESK